MSARVAIRVYNCRSTLSFECYLLKCYLLLLMGLDCFRLAGGIRLAGGMAGWGVLLLLVILLLKFMVVQSILLLIAHYCVDV